METIKNMIGLGATQQEGREPASGVTGSGVAGEPYDGGNVDDSTLGGKAAQHTDPTTDYSTNPNTSANSSTGPYTIGSGLGSNSTTTTGASSGGLTSADAVTPNAASATSASGPAIDPTSSNTTSTSGPHSSNLANKADPRVDSDNDRTTGVGSSNITGVSSSTNSGPHDSNAANKVDPRVDSDNDRSNASGAGSTGGIGSSSWMSTALPHREGNNTTTSNETSSKASAAAISGTTSHSHPEHSSTQRTGLEDIKSQPPNNLPTNVPTGTSTDFAAPGDIPSSTTSSLPTTSTNTTSDPMHAHQDIPSETVGSSVPSAYNPSHSLTGSRGSIAPTKPDYTDSPLKPAEKGGEHGTNPSAIPTAGGKKIGEDAYAERKSIQVDSIDAGLPTTATTSANTARNVGTAEATGVPSTSTTTPATTASTVGHDHEKSSVVSDSSASDHKEKKGLMEKIKEKVHSHKH